jgi:hypothetical protein
MAEQVFVGEYDFQLFWKDAAGQPTTVDASAQTAVEFSDPAVAEVVSLAADGNSGRVRFNMLGPVQMQVTPDVDRGPGERRVPFPIQIEVMAGEAASASASFTPVTP